MTKIATPTLPSEIPARSAAWFRQLALDCGADDAGVVEIERPALAGERSSIERCLPGTKTLLAFVVRMNRAPIQSPARSVANLEFHHAGDEVNEVARKIVTTLERSGVRASNPSMGFPMEMEGFPDRLWVVSHKVVAEQAGLGRMGIHRNLIHPRFGNFILLGTVLVADATEHEGRGETLDYNPCLECKLCVAACPVGAIGADGSFDFSGCYTHNYREFMGGFTEWVERVADSKDKHDYRKKVTAGESASMWQSLSFGANYKAAYCLAVCPAGEDVISPFKADRRGYLEDVVRPLQAKEEPLYVIPGSDAEAHAERRFPHKERRHVRGSLSPRTIASFLRFLPHVFQRGQSEGIDATYHFTFTGREEMEATVIIRDQRIEVLEGHEGSPNLRMTADSETWLGFLAGDRNLVWALLTRRIRLRGNPKHLLAFGRCFPS